MPTTPGEKTGQFGLWLTEYLQEQHPDKHYIVYYDHGDPLEHDNVKVIKGFLGEEVRNENRLTDIDILVANQEKEILLLIEIEESPISPKTLLGDIFTCLASTKFSVLDEDQKKFTASHSSRLIIAGFHPNQKRRKYYGDSFRCRVGEFSAPADAIFINNVEFIIDSDLDTCLGKLRQRIEEICELKNDQDYI